MLKTKKLPIIILLIIVTGISLYAITPDEIIKDIDERMHPDAKVKCVLTFLSGDDVKEEYQMNLFSKDNNQKVIVRFTAPSRQIGNDLVLIEKNVWTYNKKSGRVIKIPTNQSFGGTGFCFGDVVRLNLSDNYKAELKFEDDNNWIINLTAKLRSSPYYRIELQIKKDGKIPVKGVCYSKNNKIIKVMNYSDIKTIAGTIIPVTVTIESPYTNDEISILKIIDIKLKKYPDRIFNKRNLELHLEENY